MVKKLLALLLALVMVLAIAACTPAETPDTTPNAGNDTTPKDTEPKDTEEEHEPVTITILTHNDIGLCAGLENVNKMFTEMYPWITVEIEAVAGDQIGAVETARFAAKDCDIIRGPSYDTDISNYPYIPDGIFSKSTAVSRYEEGLYLDLSDVPNIKNWDESATKRGTYDGKMLSVPTGTVICNGVWYNKTMFDQYGLEVPTTYSAFIDVCETLKNAGENVLLTGMLDNWPQNMIIRAIAEAHIIDNYGTGSSGERLDAWIEAMWKGEVSFNDELAMRCWEKIDEVNQYWCDAAFNMNLQTAEAEFANGGYAMFVDGSWALTTVQTAEFEYGMFAFPGDDEPENGVTTLSGRGDSQWAVCAGTKYPEECKMWIDLYSSPEGYSAFLQGASGFLPYAMEGLTGLNDFAQSLQPAMEGFYLQMESAWKIPSGIGQYANLFNGGAQLASCLGTMSVQELADAANTDWETAMEQAGMR